jgi:hypothetical protein
LACLYAFVVDLGQIDRMPIGMAGLLHRRAVRPRIEHVAEPHILALLHHNVRAVSGFDVEALRGQRGRKILGFFGGVCAEAVRHPIAMAAAQREGQRARGRNRSFMAFYSTFSSG